MNDLHTWLSHQHHGLRTFRTFQQKLNDLGNGDPGQRALCRLLNGIVGSYVDTFDEEPCRLRSQTAPTNVCSKWWPAWTSTAVPTGDWPTSTVSPGWICGTRLSNAG